MSEYDKQRDIEAEGQRAAIFYDKKLKLPHPESPASYNRDAMSCEMCNLRHKLAGLEADCHAQHVALGSVLIREGPDSTVATIYKELTDDHRSRLLSLLSEIDRHKG